MPLRFATRWYWVLLTAALLPVFVSLGLWQWQRGQARQATWQQFAAGGDEVYQPGVRELAQWPRYTRVGVQGEVDGQRQFLRENLSHRGAPGYEVLTVLRLPEGSRMLVNRGWLPFLGYREQLPDVRLPDGT